MLPCRVCGANAAHAETVLFLGTCVEVCRMCHARTLVPRCAPPVEEAPAPYRKMGNHTDRFGHGRGCPSQDLLADVLDAHRGQWMTLAVLVAKIDDATAPRWSYDAMKRLVKKGVAERRRVPDGRLVHEYRRVG